MTDFRGRTPKEIKAGQRFLRQENAGYSHQLRRLSFSPLTPQHPIELWRSRGYLVQIYHVKDGVERLSVNRTALQEDGHWVGGITWDTLQRLKAECGRGHLFAVEIYPPDGEVVNVANIRHLWVMEHNILGFGFNR